MRKTFFALALVAALSASSPAVNAQSPKAASSAAPAAAASTAPAKKGGAQADTGKTMKSVLAKISLSADEKAKTDKILADAALKGAKRRDAVEAVLTGEHLAQFKSLWSAAHGHKSKASSAPSK